MQPSKVYADIANDVSYDDESSSFGSHLPPDAESLLQEEMLKLSLKDRNSTQEEIHGVHCLSPEESPAFLEASLRKLDLELNGNNIPIDQKKAYLKSQELFASQNKPTYVNSEEFRLRFLRCELFDVPTAALRIAKYLTLVLELFGEFALQRPIRMRDFSKIELREFRKGRYQFLPYRDRAGTRGRRILSVYPDEEWEKISTGLRTKIWLYLTYVAGDDIETQKNGVVMLAWFDTAWKHLSKRPVYSPQSSRVLSLCVRTTSVHICTPDTPLYRFRRSIMVMRLGKERSRVKIHVGTENIAITMFTRAYFLRPFCYRHGRVLLSNSKKCPYVSFSFREICGANVYTTELWYTSRLHSDFVHRQGEREIYKGMDTVATAHRRRTFAS